uniref:Uncharacterized protein n=1 Tax=Setaria italica TaxID=4555 RepID=K3ZZ06_SETIT
MPPAHVYGLVSFDSPCGLRLVRQPVSDFGENGIARGVQRTRNMLLACSYGLKI